jgi:quinol-cytochrome oxidoreductase complex cytochrome b subunit
VLHVCRVYLTGGFKKPREVTWISGVALAVCTVSFGVTGYSLPYDQVGYWALRIVSGVPDCIPVVGQVLVELIRGGPSVGQATLTPTHICAPARHIGTDALSLFIDSKARHLGTALAAEIMRVALHS